MKQAGRQFKDLRLALNELQRFVRNTQQLYSGKPIPNFEGMRPRELLGNWLICACMNNAADEDIFTVGSGEDGLIVNRSEGHGFQTEHVMVPRATPGSTIDVSAAIKQTVAAKQSKGGHAYANGKALVVFLDLGGGTLWYPNKIATDLPANDFDAVWVVGLQCIKDDHFIYGITLLDRTGGDAPTWIVEIKPDFNDWTVVLQQ